MPTKNASVKATDEATAPLRVFHRVETGGRHWGGSAATAGKGWEQRAVSGCDEMVRPFERK